MRDKKKQVIMTYEEHEGWLYKQKEHKKEINQAMDHLMQMEEIMEKLIKERDDIVVIENHSIRVQDNYKRKSYGYYPDHHEHWDHRYINMPRFVSGDDVAKALDQAFMELRKEIIDQKQEIADQKLARERDMIDVKSINVLVPKSAFLNLSRRVQKKIAKEILLLGKK